MVQALPMSEDQKPSHPDEKARIIKAGGFVMNGRVLGDLAVSRAFGDKQVTYLCKGK
jgi:serine/threonine protein phosphatase PrpC